eukprot:14321574-Heterocapsa_arctica.AAC.1
MIASTASRNDAARVQKYSSDEFDYIGYNPELAVRMSKPTHVVQSGGPYGNGCAHDLVSLSDVAGNGNRLRPLADH